MISIHAPRVGRDGQRDDGDIHSRHFNPRAPCGARHATSYDELLGGSISIHAPRVGRDARLEKAVQRRKISIHAPRVGRDCPDGKPCREKSEFQSTRPVWGAT